MATEEQVLAVTGYRVGTVSPFGLPKPLKILIDPNVMKEEEVSIGSGIRSTGIIIKSSDLSRALKGAEIIQLIENT